MELHRDKEKPMHMQGPCLFWYPNHWENKVWSIQKGDDHARCQHPFELTPCNQFSGQDSAVTHYHFVRFTKEKYKGENLCFIFNSVKLDKSHQKEVKWGLK